jgi:hypothetical protein
LATLAAIVVTAVAVAVTSTPTLEGGPIVVFNAAAATVKTGVAVGAAIDGPPPRRVSPHDASSMLEKGKCNKNGTENIGIQAFDAILQLSVGYRLMA